MTGSSSCAAFFAALGVDFSAWDSAWDSFIFSSRANVMNQRTYGSVTQDQASALLAQVRALNFKQQGNDTDGTEAGFGVTVAYHYVEPTQQVTLIIDHDPFWIPADVIWSQIEQRLPSGVTRVSE